MGSFNCREDLWRDDERLEIEYSDIMRLFPTQWQCLVVLTLRFQRPNVTTFTVKFYLIPKNIKANL